MSQPAELIGFAFICYGTITFVLRLTMPTIFRKLAAMQKMYGAMGGYVVHTMAYTVLPIAIGVAMLVGGSAMR